MQGLKKKKVRKKGKKSLYFDAGITSINANLNSIFPIRDTDAAIFLKFPVMLSQSTG
jgi:hypothetical protein